MDEDNVLELIQTESLPTYHKFAIFLLGSLASFGAQMLVEKGYVTGLSTWRNRKVTPDE